MYLFYRINKTVILFFFFLGQLITESQQTLYSTCQKCKLQNEPPDCQYVQCVEKLPPSVYCSEVLKQSFILKHFYLVFAYKCVQLSNGTYIHV